MKYFPAFVIEATDIELMADKALRDVIATRAAHIHQTPSLRLQHIVFYQGEDLSDYCQRMEG